MSEMTARIGADGRTFILERSFDAPRPRLWAAWTTEELFVQWWGPKGWTTTVKNLDFGEGGNLLYGMTCEDPDQKDWFGQTAWSISRFVRIDPESFIEYTDEFCDENGVAAAGMPASKIRVEFVDAGQSTLVRSTTVYASAEALNRVIAMGMEQGIRETWDRLDKLLHDR